MKLQILVLYLKRVILKVFNVNVRSAKGKCLVRNSGDWGRGWDRTPSRKPYYFVLILVRYAQTGILLSGCNKNKVT